MSYRIRRPHLTCLALVALLAPGLQGQETPAPPQTQTAPVAEEEDDGPVLLGRMTAAEVMDHFAEYRAEADAYEPQPGALELIATLQSEVVVDIVWGSWCSDSRRELPRYFKILQRANELRRMQGLDTLPIRTELIAVDREKAEPAELLEGKTIDLVPTFIVRVGEQEVGRIVETPLGLLEEDLALLILEAAALP